MNDLYLCIAMFFLNRLAYKSPTNQQLAQDRINAVAKLRQCK